MDELAKECGSLLADIASGAVAVFPELNPSIHYCGNLAFRCSNGWSVVVFNDCDEWDYIDHFRAPDGRVLEYADMVEKYPDLEAYEPSEAELRQRWGWT